MKTTEIDEFQLSPRVTLKPGDRFRITGGPVWIAPDGSESRMGPRCRTWHLDRIIRKGKRVWFEAREYEEGMLGATHLLYVSGRTYNSEIITNRAYTVRRLKG